MARKFEPMPSARDLKMNSFRENQMTRPAAADLEQAVEGHEVEPILKNLGG